MKQGTNLHVITWSHTIGLRQVRFRSPTMLSIHLVYIYTRRAYASYVHRYCACAALRANVAGRIGNRVSPAESAFSDCIGSGSSQTS